MPRVAAGQQLLGAHAGPPGRVDRHRHRAVRADDERVRQQPERNQPVAADAAVAGEEHDQQSGRHSEPDRIRGSAADDAEQLRQQRQQHQAAGPEWERAEPIEAAAGEPADQQRGQQDDDDEGHPASLAAGPPFDQHPEERHAVFETVLVADRGAGARAIVRTCQRLGVRTVVAHSAADEQAEHVRVADEVVPLGGRNWVDSYGDPVRLLEAARRSGAEAVHPGAGSLSGDLDLARAVVDAGLVWLGPQPAVLERTPEQTAQLIRDLGLQPADPGGRRLLVTLLADGPSASCLGVREQLPGLASPLLELEPAGLPPALTDRVVEVARRFAAASDLGAFAAVEVAVHGEDDSAVQPAGSVPALQAGSSATGAAAGLDLVELHLRLAAGDDVPPAQPAAATAAAVLIRAGDRFVGKLRRWQLPGPTHDLQVDAAVAQGDRIGAATDRLLAVLTVTAPDRAALLERARAAVDEVDVEGVLTTLPALRTLLAEL